MSLACVLGLSERPAQAQTFGFGSAIIGGNFNGKEETFSASDELVIGSPWEPMTGSGQQGTGAVYIYVHTGGASWSTPGTSAKATAR